MKRSWRDAGTCSAGASAGELRSVREDDGLDAGGCNPARRAKKHRGEGAAHGAAHQAHRAHARAYGPRGLARCQSASCFPTPGLSGARIAADWSRIFRRICWSRRPSARAFLAVKTKPSSPDPGDHVGRCACWPRPGTRRATCRSSTNADGALPWWATAMQHRRRRGRGGRPAAAVSLPAPLPGISRWRSKARGCCAI